MSRCNRCKRPMKGTTAYDGACECGGLIEAASPTVLRVAFRVGQGDVVAVLPDLPANDYRWVCYAHVGQHSECSRKWYYRTRRATPEEYAPLLAELRSIYEADGDIVLRVVSRISHRSKQS